MSRWHAGGSDFLIRRIKRLGQKEQTGKERQARWGPSNCLRYDACACACACACLDRAVRKWPRVVCMSESGPRRSAHACGSGATRPSHTGMKTRPWERGAGKGRPVATVTPAVAPSHFAVFPGWKAVSLLPVILQSGLWKLVTLP